MPRHTRFPVRRALVVAASLLTLGACDGDGVVSPRDPIPGAVRVARVEITGIVEVIERDSRVLGVKVTGTDGREMQRPVTWTSSDTSVLLVVNGILVGQRAGSATITATVDGVSGSTPAYVRAVVVESVRLQMQGSSVRMFEPYHIGATAYDQVGRPIPEATVRWTVSDTTILRRTPTHFEPLREGGVVLTATAGAHSASVTVWVTAPAVAGRWALGVGSIEMNGYVCSVEGIELVVTQDRGALSGYATFGPNGHRAQCNRDPSKPATGPVTTPMPPIGELRGTIDDDRFDISVADGSRWRFTGRVTSIGIAAATATYRDEDGTQRSGIAWGARNVQ